MCVHVCVVCVVCVCVCVVCVCVRVCVCVSFLVPYYVRNHVGYNVLLTQVLVTALLQSFTIQKWVKCLLW